MHWRIRYLEQEGIHEHRLMAKTRDRVLERQWLRKTILHSPLVF